MSRPLSRAIRYVQRSTYLSNVAAVISGASVAQLIPIAVSPILTRLYTPDVFGHLAVYTATTAIISGIAAARYDVALILPKCEAQAAALTYLGCSLVLVSSVLTATGVLIFELAGGSDSSGASNFYWIYLLPFAVLVSGLYQCLSALCIRDKQFRFMAVNKVIATSITVTAQVSTGIFKVLGGLIFGQFFGQFTALIILIRRNLKRVNKYPITLQTIKDSAAAYSRFPRVDVPTVLLNLSASQAPLFILPVIFSPSVAGAFFLTQRVLQVPITLISSSVLEVFKRQAAIEYEENGECKELFIKTAKLLVFIAIIPSLICFFYIDDIFKMVFGNAWIEAGVFAKLLIPALFLRFIANPLSFMIYVADKQYWNLVGMGLLLIAMLLSLLNGDSPEEVVTLISFSYSAFYVAHLIIAAKISKIF